MIVVEFIPNDAGIEEIGQSEEVLMALDEIGQAVAEMARSIGPVLTGGYVEDITVDTGVDDDGISKSIISANKFTAGFIEFGTVDTPTFRPLGTALEIVTGG